jgi:protein ImuA
MRAPVSPDVLQELRERIRGIEGLHDRGPVSAGRSTGFPALDRLLIGRGLRAGSLVEWRGVREASGAFSLGIAVAGNLVRERGTLVVVDDDRGFYPVGAAGLGVPLDRTVVVRPDDPAAGLWAWEQALRTPGVTVTLGWLPEVNDRIARRLQLAAEAGGGVGFLVRPPDARSPATWAATRFEVEGVAGSGTGLDWRLRVRVTRGQAGPGEAVGIVELTHEACALPVAPELAGPVANRRAKARRAAGPARRVRRGRG